jgi:DNA-binding protein YbaB
MVQDLVIAAVNEGIRKAQKMMAEEMGKAAGGLKIPGLTS